jgi:hypothetical protein
MSWPRRHAVIIGVVVGGLLAAAFFTWADWYTYAQEQQAHHESASFWSIAFLANWGDNAAQNWHSELLFGGAFFLLLRALHTGSEEEAEEQGT